MFDDTARICIQAEPLDVVQFVPPRQRSGGTDYNGCFAEINNCIQLVNEAENSIPVIVFLTDGGNGGGN